MANKKERPDNVAYKDGEGWVAGILPYGSNVGAPAIRPDDVSAWKSQSISKANRHMETRFNELKEEYQKLVQEYQWSELVYNSKFSFEPLIGETYHLYIGRDGNPFLSLISPVEWNMECIGSFTLTSDSKWIKI